MVDDPFDHIRDAFENPHHRGHCPNATHVRSGNNVPCGDVVTIELCIDSDQVIREFWFQATGCCLSQAAASMLAETIQGQSVDQAKLFDQTMMLALIGAKLTSGRQRCALLPLRVLHECLHSAEKPMLSSLNR